MTGRVVTADVLRLDRFQKVVEVFGSMFCCRTRRAGSVAGTVGPVRRVEQRCALVAPALARRGSAGALPRPDQRRAGAGAGRSGSGARRCRLQRPRLRGC